ncbi:hypothetical protein FS837_011790 [Tulasnella sp. UAMH 9824]|nr:hypothetical protein FS837_011790 [Tulasnella sp. UAMH 9824]
MDAAARTMEELRAFWKERIAIEDEYAKKLAKLAQLPLGTDEIGDLRTALNAFRVETYAQAAQHVNLVQTIKRELEHPSNNFISKQNNHKKAFQSAVEKLHKTKQTQEKHMERARDKYETDCVRINSYTAQSAILQGRDLEKVQTKLERRQQSLQANERDYQNLARELGSTCKRWEGEWKTYCDQCQDLEDERIEFIKDQVWAYTNAVAIVCVSDDESCERIRVQLEKVDSDKELENFVKDYGTGPMMSEPMHFISYNIRRSPPRRSRPKMASFLRSSSRGSLMQPTLPLIGTTGPGVTGPSSFGIASNASVQVRKEIVAGDYCPRSLYPAKAPTRRPPSPTAQAAPPSARTSFSIQNRPDDEGILFRVKALYDYEATIPEEFDFVAGDIIAVTSINEDGWWTGALLDDARRIPGRTVFPSNFVTLWIAIEEEYATKLAELAKLPLGNDEIGDLRVALDTLRSETDAQASQHLAFVQTTKQELEKPSENFISKQNGHKKTFSAPIEKRYKEKQTQEKYVEKARDKYESDCALISAYTAQSNQLQGKELDEVQTELERAQATVQANERDYQNFARALGDTCNRWEGEWETYCDERVMFIKDIVWAYANANSTVSVSNDESCEKIRTHLEKVNAVKELEHFVKYYGTGPIILEPVIFIPYKQSSSSEKSKKKVASFLRSLL